MSELHEVAPAFVEMANRIIYATLATVDGRGRPRSRTVHPMWQWDGSTLVGVVGNFHTPLKAAHLRRNPFVSCNYIADPEVYDTCVAECRAELVVDDAGREAVWEQFKSTPEPLGYDPGAIGVPGWDSPRSPAFSALRLTPWWLRVFPGTVAKAGTGEVLTWQTPDDPAGR